MGLVDPHPGLQQILVARMLHVDGEAGIARIGHDDADVGPPFGGRDQILHLLPGRDEIGGVEPDPLLRRADGRQ